MDVFLEGIIEVTDADQKSVFLSGEGDRWFERNASHLSGNPKDVVIAGLRNLDLKPKRVLEIGAANGHRLAVMAQEFGCTASGVEPSASAVADGKARFPGLDLRVGTADELPFADGSFDLVIFGFCLYLVDPRLHFRCIQEADRVLADRGTLVIFDFIESLPFYNNYSHLPGMRSHKMEWSRFFLASPAYRLVQRTLERKDEAALERNRLTGVDILLKDLPSAFPPNPFV